MKAWTQSTSDALCGFCGALIRSGTRFGVIQGQMVRQLNRCAQCFQSRHNAPDDPGPEFTVTQTPAAPGFQRIGELVPAGFDSKLRQANEK